MNNRTVFIGEDGSGLDGKSLLAEGDVEVDPGRLLVLAEAEGLVSLNPFRIHADLLNHVKKLVEGVGPQVAHLHPTEVVNDVIYIATHQCHQYETVMMNATASQNVTQMTLNIIPCLHCKGP